MTFLGHFVAAGNGDAPDLRTPLALFVGGIFIGGLAIGTAYFTQLTLFNESIVEDNTVSVDRHVVWLRVTIVLVLLGMLLFAAGSLCAVSVLS